MLRAEVALSLDRIALDVTLEAGPGECVAVVGPNGAGKTTLLHAIAGLKRPDRARIELDGEVLCDSSRGVDLPPARRRVGLLFQDFALFPHLSVRGNVEYGARAGGADEWLERLALSELASRKPGELSGGQKQRVALARALASGARALLLDEPFGALDVASGGAIRHELRAFLKEVRLPTLLVTHDALDARVFGDRVVVIENGRPSQSGSWAELAAAPRSAFVADLVGLNFYVAMIEAGSGLKSARVGDIVFHVLADDIGGEAYVSFAPEEVTLSAEAPHGSARNVLSGVVRDVLPMGSRARVRLDCGVPLIAEITREAAEALQAAPGRALWAAIKATAFRVSR